MPQITEADFYKKFEVWLGRFLEENPVAATQLGVGADERLSRGSPLYAKPHPTPFLSRGEARNPQGDRGVQGETPGRKPSGNPRRDPFPGLASPKASPHAVVRRLAWRSFRSGNFAFEMSRKFGRLPNFPLPTKSAFWG